MNVLHEPTADVHWKACGGKASEDIFFISIHPKLEELVDTMKTVAAEFECPVSDLGVYLQPIVQEHAAYGLALPRRAESSAERW